MEFGSVYLFEVTSRETLLWTAFPDLHGIDLTDVETAIRRLLGTCAGLPLALEISGGGVKGARVDLSNPTFAVKEYFERVDLLKQSYERAVGEHPELRHLVEASIRQCWRFVPDVDDPFKALYVLENQMTMPIGVMAQMWGVDTKKHRKLLRYLNSIAL